MMQQKQLSKLKTREKTEILKLLIDHSEYIAQLVDSCSDNDVDDSRIILMIDRLDCEFFVLFFSAVILFFFVYAAPTSV